MASIFRHSSGVMTRSQGSPTYPRTLSADSSLTEDLAITNAPSSQAQDGAPLWALLGAKFLHPPSLGWTDHA